jgi:hypothetical protein
MLLVAVAACGGGDDSAGRKAKLEKMKADYAELGD